MADLPHPAGPVIVKLPAEIDLQNAGQVAIQLRAACRDGGIVIADMTSTTFCDSRCAQELLNAHYLARARNCQLRLALPDRNVQRVLNILGADLILAIYQTVAAAREVLWQVAALLLAPEDLLHQRLHVRVLGPRGVAGVRGWLLGAQHRGQGRTRAGNWCRRLSR